MIIPRRQAETAFSGISKFLTVVEQPSGWTTERILWSVTPVRLPGWSIIFQSTHTREQTLRHLLLKLILQRLNKNEVTVLSMLVVAETPKNYEVLLLILSNQQKILKFREPLLQLLAEHNFLGIASVPERGFRSYMPEMFIFKMWTLAAKLSPKRYIGIGYNDHGTLSTAPSWKDQLTDDEEETPRLSDLQFSLERLFGQPLFRNPPFKGYSRLTSSK